jgi:ADP-ribose pyrophosphatase
MALQEWQYEGDECVEDMGIFELHRLRARSPRTGETRAFSLIETGDWVNVIALTSDREMILVRQFRHGTRSFTLEIPGGQVDRGEEPARAAARELREETGYAGEGPVELGVVTPNPAILNNRCHTFLFDRCVKVGEPELDRGEDIEVLMRPLADVPGLVASGQIDHALVICAFWWLAQQRYGMAASWPAAGIRVD